MNMDPPARNGSSSRCREAQHIPPSGQSQAVGQGACWLTPTGVMGVEQVAIRKEGMLDLCPSNQPSRLFLALGSGQAAGY